MSLENEQQNEEQETPTGTPPTFDRDDLIAAVREAGGTASVDVASEEAAAAAQAGQAPTAETPPAEDKLAKLLKQREEAHQKRETERSAARSIESDAQQRAAKIIADAQAEAKRHTDAETAARVARFRGNPIEVLRELGDPQTVVDHALRAGTPEARAQAKLEADMATTRANSEKGTAALEEIQKLRAELKTERDNALIAQVRTDFLTQHASEEKAPYLHARFEPEEIFARGDALAREWNRDGLQLGKDFDASDIVAYLEKQSKERYARLPTNPAAASSTAPGPATTSKVAGAHLGQGSAAKASANGPRTLSAAQGSERRTSPKPLSELSPDQQRAALIEEVAAARRTNPDAVF